jgi:hypothetical protein
VEEFRPRPRQPARYTPLDDDEEDPLRVPTHASVVESRRLAEANGVEGREVVLDVRRAGQRWRFVIRLYREGAGPVYVVRAYTQSRRFPPVRAELLQVLDSFRITPGR